MFDDTEDGVKALTELCEKYFEELKPDTPPTVTGLTLFLGFSHKSSLYEYSKRKEFTDPIKRALTRIELFHEERTASSDKCGGNIFILKNFGWQDTVKQEVDMTVKPVEFEMIDKGNE